MGDMDRCATTQEVSSFNDDGVGQGVEEETFWAALDRRQVRVARSLTVDMFFVRVVQREMGEIR
jgi:hypothetical protein